MIYTNKELEIAKNEKGGKVIELSSLYGTQVCFGIDNKITDYINKIDDKFHRFLTVTKTKEGFVMITNKKDDDLYLILDTLDYKYFDTNGRIYATSEDSFGEVVLTVTTHNRSNTCNWELSIFKVKNKKDVNLFKMQLTSGLVKYVSIYNGFVMLHNENTLRKYFETINKEMPDVKNIDWCRVENKNK